MNSLSWERGILGRFAVKPGRRCLDLCCGGGLITHHFLALGTSETIGVDIDPAAISSANRNFSAPNLKYMVCDITSEFPKGKFGTITWNGAIEHFSEENIDKILEKIKLSLEKDGILFGYTIIEKDTQSHPDHIYEFKSREDLMRVLKPKFKNVHVISTSSDDQFESRENLYFYCGDADLPLDSRNFKMNLLEKS